MFWFFLGPSVAVLAEAVVAFGVCVKLGLFPVHLWVLIVVRGLVWWKVMVVLVVQKLAPIWLVFFVRDFILIGWLGVLSALAGSIGIVNQSSIKRLFAFSSISNTGWIVLAVLFSSSAAFVYVFRYLVVSFLATVVFGFFGLAGRFSFSFYSEWSVGLL